MTFKKSNKSTNSAFKRDIALGNEIEHKILQSVRKKYPSAVLIPGKFKPYDIFIPENESKIEVKVDYKSQETRNIIIELFMFGEPSSLLSTEANFWVIDTGLEILWITPKKIFECILLNNIKSQKILGDGDANEKVACLIPYDLFKQYTL